MPIPLKIYHIFFARLHHIIIRFDLHYSKIAKIGAGLCVLSNYFRARSHCQHAFPSANSVYAIGILAT